MKQSFVPYMKKKELNVHMSISQRTDLLEGIENADIVPRELPAEELHRLNAAVDYFLGTRKDRFAEFVQEWHEVPEDEATGDKLDDIYQRQEHARIERRKTAAQHISKEDRIALACHAAWFMQECMPNVRYTKQRQESEEAKRAKARWSIDRQVWDSVFIPLNIEDRMDVPTVKVLREAHRNWPSDPQGYYPPRNKDDDGAVLPLLDLPHPAASYKKVQGMKSELTPSENARLWRVRVEAAERYEAVYRETESAPSRPVVQAYASDDDLAIAEGYHDFAAKHEAVRGTMYIDYRTGKDWSVDRLERIGLGDPIPPKVKRNNKHKGIDLNSPCPKLENALEDALEAEEQIC